MHREVLVSNHRIACQGCPCCCDMLASGPDYIMVTFTKVYSSTGTSCEQTFTEGGTPCIDGGAIALGDIITEASYTAVLEVVFKKVEGEDGCWSYECPPEGDPGLYSRFTFDGTTTDYYPCCDLFTGDYFYGIAREQIWSLDKTAAECWGAVTSFGPAEGGGCELCITGSAPFEEGDTYDTYTCECREGCGDDLEDCADDPVPEPVTGGSIAFGCCETLLSVDQLVGAFAPCDDCEDGCGGEDCDDCEGDCLNTDLTITTGCLSTTTLDVAVCISCSQTASIAGYTP